MSLIEELNKLVELEQRATPAPWRADLEMAGEESSEIRAGGGTLVANVYGRNDFPCITDEDPTESPVSEFAANAVLVEESRNIFPELLAVAKAATQTRLAAHADNAADLTGFFAVATNEAAKSLYAALDALQKKLTGVDA